LYGCLCIGVDVGFADIQSGHKLQPLDSSSLLVCEHCMVADGALCDLWVSLTPSKVF